MNRTQALIARVNSTRMGLLARDRPGELDEVLRQKIFFTGIFRLIVEGQPWRGSHDKQSPAPYPGVAAVKPLFLTGSIVLVNLMGS
jgi:hypothetical protein